MAYFNSLVDNVPFSFKSKHLKASRYSTKVNSIRRKSKQNWTGPNNAVDEWTDKRLK